MSFIEKLQSAPKSVGFAMEGYWVWGGSVIKGEDERYHMFASRWSSNLPFSPHWLTHSQIVRASAQTPQGPYIFEEVVLGDRGCEYWDGRMAHNPTIHQSGDTYLLFYTGTTYHGSPPASEKSDVIQEIRSRQRIGLATSQSVKGPWLRQDKPILSPRKGKWDSYLTANPSVCVLKNENILMIYKSTGGPDDLLRLGVAQADHFSRPYQRLRDDPLFCFDQTKDHVEDPYIWQSDEGYELIMKDMNGGICGEKNGGIHATSTDAIDWNISDPPLAYSRTVAWDDGSKTTQGCLERPQLLIENGKPTHVFFATANGPGAYTQATKTWNMVIPLKTEKEL